MAKLFISRGLDFDKGIDLVNERAWERSNGATRRTLVVINKLGDLGKGITEVEANVGYLNKGNHSFIFLNPPRKDDNRILGLFLCNTYGYRVVKGKELFCASSIGGPGNSESKFGIYEPGTMLACESYRMRKGKTFYLLDPEKGWVYLGRDIPTDEDEIKEA